MKQELVSVIINSFNGAKFLEKSINSVLNQTYKNLEIIFWDNASTDETKKKLQNISDNRLKVFFSNSFKKLYDAKHQAILNSNGKYLAFLDVDDWWNKDKLFKQLKRMNLEKTNISCSNYWIVNENKNSIKKAFKIRTRNKNNFDFALKEYFIGMSSLIISKKLYQNLEYGFDNSFPSSISLGVLPDCHRLAEILAKRCAAPNKSVLSYRDSLHVGIRAPGHDRAERCVCNG